MELVNVHCPEVQFTDLAELKAVPDSSTERPVSQLPEKVLVGFR
jgi:hypothetical protein